MKTLKQLCVVRETVFDSSRRDTVLDLTDLTLGQIDADEFFKTNYVTDGMRTLLREGFYRFSGKSPQSTFILTQAMGGGKTHNMLALGLLAKHPELRQEVLGDDYDDDLDEVRVVAFTGRESDAPLGIWGAIAEQLGKKEVFNPYYSPLSAPGQTAWVNLLQGKPLLILLDELPPYFENARAREIGNTDLATVTTTALSNLLVAVNRPELNNVCIVISDLKATYGEGSEQIGIALRNLENEVSRGALPLDPVQHNTPEIYHILRKRIFLDIPHDDEIKEIAASYAQAVEDARQMDVTSASPEEYARRIREAYPFHFSIRDLYSRFRENPGFQQTRDLIRLMRTVVAHMYESGRADQAYLIHPYDIDLNHKDTLVQVSRINPKLENAISHDIASGGTAEAETIDANRSGQDAQDTATLLFMASLSNVPGTPRGLTRSEVVSHLCAPGRDVSQLEKNVLRPFFTSAWYLHTDTDGRLFFKDVQNLNARLKTTAESYNRQSSLKELRQFLSGLFEPTLKDVYQRIQVLPGLDEITVDADKVTLVITEPRPGGGLSEDLQAFFDDLDYQNRVLFLTGQRGTLQYLIDKAARLKAIRHILKEMQTEKVPEHDPQYISALDLEEEITLQLLSAARETFTTLIYPHFSGLRSADFVMNFTDNNYNGEKQIRHTLEQKGKFTTEIEDDTFRKKCEQRLFTQKEMLWSEIQKRAAAYTEWPWHHPDALKRLKERLVHEDKWRESGSYVEKPPFPKPETSIRFQEMERNHDTGEVRLRLTPVHGNTVYYEVGGEATTASAKIEDYRNFTTDALRVSFLCVDSGGEHQTGPAIAWENKITIQSRDYQSADGRVVELKDSPQATIYYTTDGSNPLNNGGVYNGPFVVPKGTQVVLAVAKKDGIVSEQHQRRIDWEAKQDVVIDPNKPAQWRRRHNPSTTKDVYDFMDWLQMLDASAQGVRIVVTGEQWVDLSLHREISLNGAQLKEAVEYLRGLLDSGEVSLEADVLQFGSGQQLLDWVEKEKTEIRPNEVEQ
ncbi:MAG: DUF499 domain-containing protein [Ardenticatenaceae bacterium]|nr:DUF499 domain-containing protein [Ardenticatenaceae bacterium]